jgi:membrane protein
MIFLKIFQATIKKWNTTRVATMAAAISYYTIFAIGPSILVFLFFIRIFYSDQYAVERLVQQVSLVVGSDVGLALYNLIWSLQSTQDQGFAGVVGFVLLFLTAFGLINELRMSLVMIWETRSEKFEWKNLFKNYLRNLTALSVVGIFWIIYILVGDGFKSVGNFFNILYVTNFVTPFFQIFVTTALVLILHKILIYSKIPIKPLLVGSFITSFLLHLSFVLLSYYINIIFKSPFYGTAGTVVLTMFWVYLCAHIFLFGGCLTWSICKTHQNLHLPCKD